MSDDLTPAAATLTAVFSSAAPPHQRPLPRRRPRPPRPAGAL